MNFFSKKNKNTLFPNLLSPIQRKRTIDIKLETSNKEYKKRGEKIRTGKTETGNKNDSVCVQEASIIHQTKTTSKKKEKANPTLDPTLDRPDRPTPPHMHASLGKVLRN
jgi:hypothetical protein